MPLYYQVAELLKARIVSGELRPGDQLASAQVISEVANVSRMTARQALGFLQSQGYVIARQGAGTFVAERKLTHRALHLLGFSQEMIEQGVQPSSDVLQQGVTTPNPQLAAALQLGVDDPVVKIVRRRLSEGVPVLLETVYLPHVRFPGLELDDVGGSSLYAVLADRYGIKLETSRQTLEAVAADTRQAAALEVPVSTALICLEGVTNDEIGPVEHFQALFRGDRFKFELESSGNANGGHDVPPEIVPRLTSAVR